MLPTLEAMNKPQTLHVRLSKRHREKLDELTRVYGVGPSDMVRRLIDHCWETFGQARDTVRELAVPEED